MSSTPNDCLSAVGQSISLPNRFVKIKVQGEASRLDRGHTGCAGHPCGIVAVACKPGPIPDETFPLTIQSPDGITKPQFVPEPGTFIAAPAYLGGIP
jgi:hypothetical protein